MIDGVYQFIESVLKGDVCCCIRLVQMSSRHRTVTFKLSMVKHGLLHILSIFKVVSAF